MIKLAFLLNTKIQEMGESNMAFRKSALYFTLAILSLSSLTGCGSLDPVAAVSLGLEALTVLSVSHQDIVALSNQACQVADKRANVLANDAPEVLRLKRIAQPISPSIIGADRLNIKVYKDKDYNAFAMANGCIRFNSAMLAGNTFSDGELTSVLIHELGHVALNHFEVTFKKMNAVALAVQAGGGASNNAVLASPIFQQLVMGFIKGQHSQSEELEADLYSLKHLPDYHVSSYALVSMLRKMEKQYGRSTPPGPLAYFSSHPRIDARIKAALEFIHNKKLTEGKNSFSSRS